MEKKNIVWVLQYSIFKFLVIFLVSVFLKLVLANERKAGKKHFSCLFFTRYRRIAGSRSVSGCCVKRLSDGVNHGIHSDSRKCTALYGQDSEFHAGETCNSVRNKGVSLRNDHSACCTGLAGHCQLLSRADCSTVGGVYHSNKICVQVGHHPLSDLFVSFCLSFFHFPQVVAYVNPWGVMHIRKSASQYGNFAWLPCIAASIAALVDCHDVMLIDCTMKNASVDAKNIIGSHLKFSSWRAVCFVGGVYDYQACSESFKMDEKLWTTHCIHQEQSERSALSSVIHPDASYATSVEWFALWLRLFAKTRAVTTAVTVCEHTLDKRFQTFPTHETAQSHFSRENLKEISFDSRQSAVLSSKDVTCLETTIRRWWVRLWADVECLQSSDPPSSWNISVFVQFRRPEETTERKVACFTFLSTWSGNDSGLHSNVFKALSVDLRQVDLSTVKFANFLPELLTQADTITSNKKFEHWRQSEPTCRKFARAMKTKGKKTTAR